MISKGRLRYSTKDDLFLGFSDRQVEDLMKNMTIFMLMDYCPSPCDICAFSARKSREGTIMDFSLVEELIRSFGSYFDSNNPNWHASDNVAYHGRNDETFANVLELQREHRITYTGVQTAFPPGAEKVLWQMLNMKFVSEKHPDEDEYAQLVVPQISRHKSNKAKIARFLSDLESDERYYRKFVEKGPLDVSPDELIYEVRTDMGIRRLKVIDIPVIPIGDAQKYAHEEKGKDGRLLYQICINPGVAVLPTGFYNYTGENFSFPQLLENRITPETFNVQPRTPEMSFLLYERETATVVHRKINVPFSG